MVWRALGGLDSIVQAAGRCNREGAQPIGHVFIFRSPTAPPPGTPRKALDVTVAMLAEHRGTLDLSDPTVFDSYFRRLYMLEDQDKRRIQTYRQELRFATVAREFKMIEDGFDQTVIVPYAGSSEKVKRLRQDVPNGEAHRALQLYSVQVPARSFERLQRIGIVDEVVPGVFAIRESHGSIYDERFGLAIDSEPSDETKGGQ